MATLVSFRDATLGYGGTPALSGLTLDVVGEGPSPSSAPTAVERPRSCAPSSAPARSCRDAWR